MKRSLASSATLNYTTTVFKSYPLIVQCMYKIFLLIVYTLLKDMSLTFWCSIIIPPPFLFFISLISQLLIYYYWSLHLWIFCSVGGNRTFWPGQLQQWLGPPLVWRMHWCPSGPDGHHTLTHPDSGPALPAAPCLPQWHARDWCFCPWEGVRKCERNEVVFIDFIFTTGDTAGRHHYPVLC